MTSMPGSEIDRDRTSTNHLPPDDKIAKSSKSIEREGPTSDHYERRTFAHPPRDPIQKFKPEIELLREMRLL